MDSLNAGALHHVQDIGKLLHKVRTSPLAHSSPLVRRCKATSPTSAATSLASTPRTRCVRPNPTALAYRRAQPHAVEQALSAVIAQAESELRDKVLALLSVVVGMNPENRRRQYCTRYSITQ